MKKSVLFRIALVMLVLTMVTSCFVGGTFAKYVTSKTGADSARVAKFGVGVTVTGETFAEVYENKENGNTAATTASTKITVDAEDNKEVVAPGTKGNMFAIALTGTPEVDVEVKYEAIVDLGDNWKDADDKYYCPLVITVGTSSVYGLGFDSADAFEAAVENLIADHTAEYDANTDLSVTTNVAVPSVSWEWPFSTSPENDVKDTYLGDQAAAGNAATVALTVKATVTQID